MLPARTARLSAARAGGRSRALPLRTQHTAALSLVRRARHRGAGRAKEDR
jgi:hypothetical protein